MALRRATLPLLFLLTAAFGCTGGVGSLGDAGTPDNSDAGASDAGVVDGGPLNPAWFTGHALNEWFVIPGTQGAGGSAANAYSGMAIREDTSELWIAAAGGHSDSFDNRVVSLDLRLDAPTWVIRKAASTSIANDVAYYPDGTPGSRHLYQTIHWVASVHRVMLVGNRGGYPNAYHYPQVDGFNPDTNNWDPAGTWADESAPFSGVVRDGNGHIWTNGFAVFAPETNTWSEPLTSHPIQIRFPVAYDSRRNQLFSLMWADGQGYGNPGFNSSRIPVGGNTQYKVTLAPSPALTRLQSLVPVYAAMVYDPGHDRFLFYDGRADPGEIFVVTPGATDDAPYSVSILDLGPGSATPPATVSAGINSRFRYVPALRGIVAMPDARQPLYFIRLQ
jgi:hypothetical protein